MSIPLKPHSPLAVEIAPPPSKMRGAAVASCIGLLLLCVMLSALRWGKLDRFWGDSSRWLFEAYRMSLGEQPYRDFAWQYPPLSIWIWGAGMALFGAKYAVAQLLIDFFSGAIVIATWNLARRFVSNSVAIAAAAALACAGASNTGNFALFSLLVYTPAILTAVLGILMLVRELIIPPKDAPRYVWLVLAGLVAVLSKPESIAAAIGCFVAAAVLTKSVRRAWISIGVAIFVPGAVVYVLLGSASGWRNVIEGVGGYGLASVACPWWPTGLGLLGAALALGHSLLAAGLLSLFAFRTALRRLGWLYWAMWGVAFLSLAGDLFYFKFASFELPILKSGVSPVRIAAYYLSTGTLLLPVMWTSLVFLIAAAFRIRRLSRSGYRLLILIVPAALISLRGLFTGTMSELPSVAPAAYAIWFIVAGILVIEAASFLELPPSRAAWIGTLALAAFAMLRFAGTVVQEVRTPLNRVSTEAGPIQLQDGETSAAVYSFLQNSTAPGEKILDVAAGGIGLASHRRSPIFSTQFSALMPSPAVENRDLAMISADAPRFVVANADSGFGAQYGICQNTGCSFPRLVWRSEKLACDSQHHFPVLEFIQRNYREAARFGEKVIYERR
jgi:hypothetical protein